jgi:hypothetical protein
LSVEKAYTITTRSPRTHFPFDIDGPCNMTPFTCIALSNWVTKLGEAKNLSWKDYTSGMFVSSMFNMIKYTKCWITNRSYRMVCIYIYSVCVNAILYEVKMLMFCNVHTTNLTLVDLWYKNCYTIAYAISDTNYNI